MNSGRSDELLPAFGASDGDLSLPPGNPDGLMALGTVEIAVVPVLQTVENQKKLPVLLIPLVGIPGKCPINGPEHQCIAQHKENHPHGLTDDEFDAPSAAFAFCSIRSTFTPASLICCIIVKISLIINGPVQPVGAIPPGHKAAKPCAHACAGLVQPERKFAHKYPPFPQGK